MPWWGWITVGALLLVAEMAVVDLDRFVVGIIKLLKLAVGPVEINQHRDRFAWSDQAVNTRGQYELHAYRLLRV